MFRYDFPTGTLISVYKYNVNIYLYNSYSLKNIIRLNFDVELLIIVPLKSRTDPMFIEDTCTRLKGFIVLGFLVVQFVRM